MRREERRILVHEDCGGGPGVSLSIEELRRINGCLNFMVSAWHRFADAPENAERRQAAIDEAALLDELNSRLARLP